MINGKYANLNKNCIIVLVISTIIGFFNPYEYYATIIWNFMYFLVMFIYFINLKVARSFIKGDILGSKLKVYIEKYLKFVEGKKVKIFMIGALCIRKIEIFVMQRSLNLGEVDLGFNFWKNEFLLDNALLMLILATIAEIAVVITFSIRIWKENG